MAITPGDEVVSPPRTEPAHHGLLESARMTGHLIDMPADSRWESGFVFQPENCIPSEVWLPCGGNDQLIFGVTIDATGGSWQFSYDGNTVTLPWNATAAELEQAIITATNTGGGSVYPDQIIVRGGPGSPDSDTGANVFFVVLQANATQFEWYLTSVNDDPGDPLTGGDGFGFYPIQIPGDLTPVPDVKKDYDGEQGPIRYTPFVVEVPYTCSSWGFQVNDYEGKALRQLDAGLGKALEHEFWTGAINAANPNLTYWTPNDDAHILNPGGATAPTPVSVTLGLALLSGALAQCANGSRGMIHATPVVVGLMAELYLIDDDDTNENAYLSTRSRDDIVVSGSGYTGTGPFGQPAPTGTQAWMFATGMVDVRLGEPMVYPEEFAHALDRATNTVTFRGEQVAAVSPDACCMFAVLVDYDPTPA